MTGALSASRGRKGVCFALTEAGGRKSYLAFPPGTSATAVSGSRFVVIDVDLGGLRTGDRVVVTPDAVDARAALPGCPAGRVVYSGWITRLASPPTGSQPAGRCDAVATSPFDCHVYRSDRGSEPGTVLPWLHTSPVRMWAEPLNGSLTLVVAGPVNAIDVPIRTTASGGTSDGKHSSATAVGCASGVDCRHDAWLAGFFSRRVTYDVGGTVLTLWSSAKQRIVLHATRSVPPVQGR